MCTDPEIASATPSASPRATTTTATGQATMRALRSIASNEQRELSEQLLRKAIDESTYARFKKGRLFF